jgi:hypothetical protein
LSISTSSAQKIQIGSSPAFLDTNGALKRLPRAPARKRPEKFWEQFEEFCLFYDCFWTQDRASVLLVAPPPRNLEKHYRAARYIARPS